MTFEEYQIEARRTQDTALSLFQRRHHALFGLAAEVGEVMDLFQKHLQGHPFDEAELKLELGDVLWMLTENADNWGWTLEEIAQANIDKRKIRYPVRFSPEQSIHREDDKRPGARHYAKGEGHRTR